MLETGEELRRLRINRTPLIIGAAVLIAGGGLAYLEWRSAVSRPAEESVLTQQARDYLPSLDLSEVEMSAKQDALGQTLLTIEGLIVNLGDRAVDMVELNCVFRDVNGLEIAREKGWVVRSRTSPLSPSEQQRFRLAFDNIPDDWNQTMPNLYVSRIVFLESE